MDRTLVRWRPEGKNAAPVLQQDDRLPLGVFGTPLLNNMNPKVKESLEASVPFPKRLGKAEEYASLAMEMIRNTYFNGQAVRLDGAIRMAPR